MADAVVKLVQSRAVVSIGGGELVAMLAAQAAEPFAIRAEAALAEIEDIATGAPDAPSIFNKLDKAANLSDLTDFAAARANLGVRYVGGRTFYVRPDGSDTNTGLANTSVAAFRTIQKAINAAYSIDAKGSVVQIRVADGTYAESIRVYGRLVGAFDDTDQPFRIIGNETTPANVVIRPVGADAVRVGDKATVLLAGLTFGTTTSGNGIYVSNYGFVQHRNCRFTNVAGEMILTTSHAFVQAIGNTTVAGNAVSFIHATNKSIVSFSGRTLTYEGTIAFSTYLYGLNTSVLDLSSTTIVGKASGGITVHVNSILNVSSCIGIWTGVQPMFVANGGLISAEDKVAARTFYVRSDASSQNNSGFGNTVDEAFPSIQAAINRLAQMPYDLVGSEAVFNAGYGWIIIVAAGSYIGDTVVLADTRFSWVRIQGASSSTTIVRGYSSTATRTSWNLRNQRIGTASQPSIRLGRGAEVTIEGVDFATCAYCVIADYGARLIAAGDFSISGSVSDIAFLGRYGSLFDFANRTVTLTGTPAIGVFFNIQSASVAGLIGCTFSGAATGKRYDVRSNGVIETNSGGPNFLPGSVAGTTATGGQYV